MEILGLPGGQVLNGTAVAAAIRLLVLGNQVTEEHRRKSTHDRLLVDRRMDGGATSGLSRARGTTEPMESMGMDYPRSKPRACSFIVLKVCAAFALAS